MKKIIISVFSAALVFVMTSSSALAVKNRTIKKHAVLGMGALLLGPAFILHNSLVSGIPHPFIEFEDKPNHRSRANRSRARHEYCDTHHEYQDRRSRHHRPRNRHYHKSRYHQKKRHARHRPHRRHRRDW